MTTVTNAQSAEAARTRSGEKARANRRMIVAFVAKMAIEGASDGDLERALVLTGQIHPNALRIRRGETEVRKRTDSIKAKKFGLITDELGLTKYSGAGKRVTVYHVTAKGLTALGLDPSQHWHHLTRAAT